MDNHEEVDRIPFTCCCTQTREGEENTDDDGVKLKTDRGSDSQCGGMTSGQSYNCPLVIFNDEDEFIGIGMSDEVVGSAASACTSITQEKKVQECFEDVFNFLEVDGRVEVSKILEYLKINFETVNENDTALEDLWYLFDPDGKDVRVDIETFREVINTWTNVLQQRSPPNKSDVHDDESLNLISFASSSLSPLTSSPIHIRQSSFGIIRPSVLFNCTFGSLEGFGGDVTKPDQIELVAELGELQFQNKMLNERISKLLAQLSTTEESNTALIDEKEELNKRLSCFQTTVVKNKELESENVKLNNKLLCCESESAKLRKKISELEKEILTLDSRIRDMKEDELMVCIDLEQSRILTDSLRRELNELNLKVERLELNVDSKETKLVEANKKCQENETLTFYWRTMSEELRAEKNKLENELSQAVDDIDRLKRICKLSVSTRLAKKSKKQTPARAAQSHSMIECVGKELNRHSALMPLSIKQELEDLVGKDHLPSPFCEKNAFSFNHLPQTNNSCNGSDDASDNIFQRYMKLQNQVTLALKNIRSTRKDVAVLFSVLQQLKRTANLKLRSDNYYRATGVYKSIGCNGDTNENVNKLRKSSSDVTPIRNFKMLNNMLDSTDSDSDSSSIENDGSTNGDDQDYTLGPTMIRESQNLNNDVTRCLNISTDYESNTTRCNEYESSNSIWGKSKDLDSGFSDQRQLHIRAKFLKNLVPLNHSTPVCRGTDDLFQRLLADVEYRNSAKNAPLFVDEFHKMLLNIAEKRSNLVERVHHQRQKRETALENVDKELNKLFIKSTNFTRSCDGEAVTFHQLLVCLIHECECYGAFQEEVYLNNFIDKLLQYLENIDLNSENDVLHSEKVVVNGIKDSDSHLQCSNGRVDAFVQTCQNDDYSLKNGNTIGLIEENGMKTDSSMEVPISRFCDIAYCWKEKISDVFSNLLSGTQTVTSSYTFLGVTIVVVLGAILCYLLVYGNSCSSTTNHSACGKTWSEILKPHVRQQHPPQIF